MISDSQVLVNSIEFPSLERSFEMAFEDFLVLQDAQVRKQKFDASTQLINMCNIICHNYVPWLSQIYNGDGCVRTLLKHQRTVDILAECNMRGMCIKVKRGPLLYKYLSWKTWQTHRISKTTKVKNRCEASAPPNISIEIFSSLLLWFIIHLFMLQTPKKHPPNWNSMKTSCCTFSIHGLALCTYLALRAGDVFSPQLRHCWGEHAQGDRQDDQTWLHLKRKVLGLRRWWDSEPKFAAEGEL